jgi:outer membrane protein assembly factor BamB
MMGNMFAIYALPTVVTPALVAWAVATRHSSDIVRRATMVVAIFLAASIWVLFRTEGIMGTGAQLHWRWTMTPEERLLAKGDDEPKAPAPAPAAVEAPKEAAPEPPTETPAAAKKPEKASPSATAAPTTPPPSVVRKEAEWPGFRGRGRDGVVHGVRISTDWSKSPPVEMWRRAVGPGWSSFAVRGDVLYTQEQRGEQEVVSAYRVSNGQPVWRHRDPVRFWESNGGAGPRATPTLDNDRVYTVGATGILNALDANTGAVIWSHNIASDTGKQVPMWGFSSSPLVIKDVVIVAATGTMVAYDAATGAKRWSGPAHGGSYSSPQQSTLDGVPQVLLLSAAGATSIAPSNGKLLWDYPSPEGGATIVQPAVLADGDILISATAATGGMGIRRIGLERTGDAWKVQERWMSTGLKPYFNDFVVHKGYAYGFDGSILSCIDLKDGARKWKGGRYGQGQLILLPEEDALLVVSEEGELALVSATPDQFTEIARVPALNGKTWNHPVVVGDVLLVRNDQEMAAFRLTRDAR